MPGSDAGTSRLIVALLLGLAATLAVVGLHLAGWDHRVELLTLDFRYARLSSAPPTDAIVHIDIDDRSLEELGRWPWPRAQLAGMIDVLAAAGAHTIALDIILPEPQETRFESEAANLYQADFTELVGAFSPRAVFDDQILCRAMRQFGRVFLPMHVDLSRPEDDVERRLARILAAEPDLDPPSLARRAGLQEPPSPPILQGARKAALELRVQAALTDQPTRGLKDLAAEILGDGFENERTEAFDVVRRAYLRTRALSALERFAVSPDRLDAFPARTGRIAPPLVTLAEVCAGSGFVTFDPGADGVVRQIPLLAGDGKAVYPQFALALACDVLGQEHHGQGEISADASAVTVRFGDGFARSIPVDDQGYMLINWIRRGSGEPAHVSAAKIGAVREQQQSVQRNRDLRRVLILSLLPLARELPTLEIKDLYWRIVELDRQIQETYQHRIAAEAERRRTLLFAPGDVVADDGQLPAHEGQLEDELDGLCARLETLLGDEGTLAALLAKPDPATQPAEGESLETATAKYEQRLAEAKFRLAQAALAERASAEIAEHLAAEWDELRGLVGGKLCLIGSTASGAADFVPTPVDRRAPGAVVHSNILNTIVSGAFVRRAPFAVNLAAILAMGLLVAWVTASRPVYVAGPALALAMVGYAAANALLVFSLLNTWLAMWHPLVAMAASFAVVTAYRQLTEERAKRRIRQLFAHALSPALVDRLMEDPSLAKLGGERRELTFFFSDLQGFTPLSERLGEEQTVRLLNRYFDRMTDVVQNRCGGYLNKFLGDGLFVFFGAPVFQDDHAARALRAAVDCQAEIRRLSEELAAERNGGVNLTCRIGLSTGEVMVGNCGSSQRMDYTAIGDPVNLASRLESANKFFGTRILVADETWRQGRDESLLARPLGKVVVVGKVEPVAVWHVLGPAGEADERTREAFGEFAEAVELFGRRQFADAAETFRRVAAALGDDGPTRVLLDLCLRHQAEPPGPDWDGAIHLTEK